MESISSRIAKVTPSLTLAVTNQAKAMIAKGEEVYALAGGEPEVDTPDFIKAAAASQSSHVDISDWNSRIPQEFFGDGGWRHDDAPVGGFPLRSCGEQQYLCITSKWTGEESAQEKQLSRCARFAIPTSNAARVPYSSLHPPLRRLKQK